MKTSPCNLDFLRGRLAVLCGAIVLALAGSASAVTFTVTTATDFPFTSVSSATGAITSSTGNGQVTLRSAVVAANQNGAGSHTINVPSSLGTYTLSATNPSSTTTGTQGGSDLQVGVTGSVITIIGTGGGTPKIAQTIAGTDVFTTGFDANGSPGVVNLTLNNLEITGGTYTGIFTGVDNGSGGSSTTIQNCNIHDNTNTTTVTGTGQGGAIQNLGGNLTIINSTFTNNSAPNAADGQGGAIYYELQNSSGPYSVGNLSISGCTFSGNKAGYSASGVSGPAGGAIFATVVSTGTALSITGCTFSGNQATAIGDGGAIALATIAGRGASILSNTFSTNAVTQTLGHGGAIAVQGGPATLTFNRFIGNTAATAANGSVLSNSAANTNTVNANDNWWSRNTGPAAGEIFSGASNVTASNWLQLGMTAQSSTVPVGGNTVLTASFLKDSAAGTIAATNLGALIGQNISYAPGTLGSISAAQTTVQSTGTATATFNAGATSGSTAPNASVDSATAPTAVSVQPTVTPNTAALSILSPTMVIGGSGFSTTASNNTVAFNDGAVGSVTSATATTLNILFSTRPTAVGSLTAIVTTNGVSSGAPVQVATVIPFVQSSTSLLSANAPSIVINGNGFSATAANDVVTFTDGAAGNVTSATATSLTVTFTSQPAIAGTLSATVTVSGVSSAQTQVATVIPGVNMSTAALPATSTTVTITGNGFDPTAANNTVSFNDGASGSVTSASSTSLTVTFSTKPTSAGSLTASVTTDGSSSGSPVQIATVTPVVTMSTAQVLTTQTTLTINGFGFSATTGNDSVAFNLGAVASVTTASATRLTVTFSTQPTAGSLTAVVTANGVTSGPAVQVATEVALVITPNTANLAQNAPQIVINGTGFDPNPANDTVSFSDGAVGTVTSASGTSLTVTFSTQPSSTGPMNAIVTVAGLGSTPSTQVATIVPVPTVSNSTAALPINAATIVINGTNFSPTPANDSVVFNDGAAGNVTSASANSLTVTFTTQPSAVGSLTAVVTSLGVSNTGPVQVATVVPVVTSSPASLPANSAQIVISGFGFDSTPANNTVAFNDGATGTVTSASATSLTVTFSKNPVSAGSLTAVVTTDGVSSGAAVQVATVTPVVTSSAAALPANAVSVVINGFGFSATPANNSVAFNDGAIGSVTSASATSLTVTFSTNPATAGPLTASVTANGVGTGGPGVQVATVTPVVTPSAAALAANATSIVINGFGFDPTPANNTVAFNDGAAGSVTTASPTSLTVTFSTAPATAGSLTAVVTTDTVSSGAAVQVATIGPVVTQSTANLAANAPTLVINGFGFDPTAANNTVVFNDGAAGSVTTASATSLTVTFSKNPATAGALTAIVTTGGVASGPAVQVATITPVVTVNTAALAVNAASVVINGFGFDPAAANDSVVFNDGAIGSVTSASATSLTVTFSTNPATAGALTASVTVGGVGSGGPGVQVATVTPVVTPSAAALPANATSIVINGFGFDPTPANNTVAFNDGAAGSVTTASATSLTVTFSTSPTTAGNLTAVVTTDSVSSGAAVQVATIGPVVTQNTATLGANVSTLVINGFGFDPTPANNTVVFNDGAAGSVTTASATSLTVTFSTNPTTAGSLTAIVTTGGVSSGAAVQVATVAPVVTANTADLPANAPTLVINGFGFDPTPANNTVTLDDGAAGNVTAASATSLTVTFTTQPASVGALDAVVVTDGVSSASFPVSHGGTSVPGKSVGKSRLAAAKAVNKVSVSGKTGGSGVSGAASPGGAVQVATVIPVVTPSTAALPANAPSIVIDGFAFDPTPANNTVVFNDGAVGTVTSATANSLTVTFSTAPATAGNLTAVVTTDGLSSGAAVQVAAVGPVVTSSVANLAANAASIVINGFGFDPTPANNTVVFNDGAVGAVTSAAATSLTVTFSKEPKVSGALTAVVTTGGSSSGSAVQVATVIPVVTASAAAILTTSTTVTINGFGFAGANANNSVAFNLGAAGAVTTSSPTQLVVTFSTQPSAGNLTAVVTSNGSSSGVPVQVATVDTLSITPNTANLAQNAPTIVIAGVGFSPTAANDTVVFDDGAAGAVTAATATQLTVRFSTQPTATGVLNATVTVAGLGSAGPTQVATIVPVPTVTLNKASLPINAASIVISGTNFSPTIGNDSVVFNDGAVGNVTAATATSLTVAFTTPPAAVGNLTAAVTSLGVSSGAPVQVATVVPVVTANAANLLANATSLVIKGFGFDPTAANNTVAFNDGAVGTVATATATSLTINFSTKPAVAGSLTAVVTTNSVSSGSAVQVATVVPVVTLSKIAISTSAPTVTINGFGFAAANANNSVVLNLGAVGTVTTSSPTQLVVTFTTQPTIGNLTAVVTSNASSSGAPVQIATVNALAITPNTANLAQNAPQIIIAGGGFSPTAANDSVTFDDGAAGTVIAASATQLTVRFSTQPVKAGVLNATVTVASVGAAGPTQVATVVAPPTVTSSTASLAINAPSIVIAGSGFSTTAANNSVTFNDGAVGTVTFASASSLTVSFTTQPAAVGKLTAIVTSSGGSSGAAVQVATVVPVVTASTANLLASAAGVIINGFGFDPVAANDTIVFNDGAVGSVTSATATSLTVAFSKKPVTAGSLTAVVTTDGASSGAAVQVATIVPVVTASAANLPANAAAVVINGFGFDPKAASNTVVLSDGAVGTVSAASATSITVTFSTNPTTAGKLTAVVTTDGVSSGAAVQVATVSPVVTGSVATLPANAASIVINGFGFDSAVAKNTVVFNDGAAGSVTAASATSLTVTFTTNPVSAGSLTAVVTTDGVGSGAAVQVATIGPVVTFNAANLAANAATVVINGFGFDPAAAKNTVVFNDGAVGSVTTASATSLTVTFSTTPSVAAALTAVVTTNSVSSNKPVQVATVVPVVTLNTAEILTTSSTVTIDGFGFAGTSANNSVVFNLGAAGTVTKASPTQLVVAFTTQPAVGKLTAVVTSNTFGSGAPVQVATVGVFSITPNKADLAQNAPTIVISGVGFSPTAANDTVVFNDGAVGTVTAATGTQLTVAFTTQPKSLRALNATVTVTGLGSTGPTQVATVVATPAVAKNTSGLPINSASIVITGTGFSATAAGDSVVFNDGAVGSVTAASATSLTVTFATLPSAVGSLTAVVTVNGGSSGAPVQVATITPVVNASVATLAANAPNVVVTGIGFDPAVANDTVVFNDGAVGSVTAASANSLTVTFSTLPTSAGALTAVVTTDGVGSGAPVQVAAVTPVVTANVAEISTATPTVTIHGFGFASTNANNTVKFNGPAAGVVTSSSPTQLVVTFSTQPAPGKLFAVVTSNGIGSGAQVEVAAVVVLSITPNTANLARNAPSIVISGTGFSATAANDTVVFDDGAVGTVTAATATQLTVTFTSQPAGPGALNATVTVAGLGSTGPTQVATVVPVPTVTKNTSGLPINAASIVIKGTGFSARTANDSVVFNDGAVGAVTAASATSLTVTFSTPPSAVGSLTAVVTANGVSSGAAVQVATVQPVVTASVANLAANAATVLIKGLGFDPAAANDTVVFNDGAVGSVTAASATSLTVTFSTEPAIAGALTAIVTADGAASGAAVQIATVVPVVTLNTAEILTTSATVTIDGFGFAGASANNSVVFNLGAAGTVTKSSPTQLVVTFTTQPTVGNLTAVVTSNGFGSGAAVQVATVGTVSITPNTANLAQNAPSIVISGAGFSATATNDTVVFNDGAVGTVTAATATQLSVTFTTEPTGLGALDATVTVAGLGSTGPTQVATVVPVPTVTKNTGGLPIDAASIVIKGTGFSATAANDSVVFNDGAVGSVTAASATSLTVTFSTPPSAVGSLSAVVTANGVPSGAAVQVATVEPVVTASVANLAANAPAIVIKGLGFDPTASKNTVVFNDGAVGSVTAASSTSLTVTFSTEPVIAGVLTAVVTTDGVSSGAAVQVATVIPVVTASAANIAANTASVVINGFGFNPTAANDKIVFNDGAVGKVTAASATSLSVTFTTLPATAGNLTAIVTAAGVSSGASVQVATITPIVTASAANLAASTASVVISGFGFDPTPGNNKVVFNDGAVGSVTAASATSLTVTFSTNPAKAGSLTAVVTTDGVGSGVAVQVATIAPVVTSNPANLAANAGSVVIKGLGFDPTAANDAVILNDGAVGSVTAASATSLTVTFSTEPAIAGVLTAIVTVDGVSSGAAVQVATVVPIVTVNTAEILTTAATVTIDGFGFAGANANNSVVFNLGAAGTVTKSSPTQLVVTFTTQPTVGNLTAVVTSNGFGSGAAVQVATVGTVSITPNTANLAQNAPSVVISGAGFSATATKDTVVFNDGAVGTVSAATATQLTVTFTTQPAGLGALDATVTVAGLGSAGPTQVATVVPVPTVTKNASGLPINAASIVIKGTGFSATAANDRVAFNNGAVGSVTAASATSLTVTFSTPPSAVGSLTAVVAADGVSSGAAVQVATVEPVVTASVANLAANAPVIVIKGLGFDPTASKNTVVFNDGAVGSVTAASATSLSVTFSTEPAIAGALTAIVTTDGVSSGAAVQVATVVPVVTLNTAEILTTSTAVTIDGFGFAGTNANNSVVFNLGAAGTVTKSSPTQLVVTFTSQPTVGKLMAVVTSNGFGSGAPVQVATVGTLAITPNTSNLAQNAPSIVISGNGFSPTVANDTVVFSDGAAGTVTAATATQLTVTFTTQPAGFGALDATVTVAGLGSAGPTRVATVVPVPTVTKNTGGLPINAASIVIKGTGFSATAANDGVVFNDGAVGSVTAASATSLTVTFSTPPKAVGSLTAVVTADGVSSGAAVQVATVEPVVTASAADLAANGATVVIKGLGFDPTASKNAVVFNDGAAGSVTAASPTSLTVTFSTEPAIAGVLTAVVTTDGVSSAAAVQVATVVPVVTLNPAEILTSSATVTIDGFGFAGTNAKNAVVFNLGAAGTVTKSSPTQLVVTFSKHPAAGSLTAVVVSNSSSSGAPVQVATVGALSITPSNASLAQSAPQIVISGLGFSPTPANDSVTFDDGAVGRVTAATSKQLTVVFSTKPTGLGALSATVSVAGIGKAGPTQVATIVSGPAVKLNTAALAINAPSIVISGSGFSATPSNDSVVFNDGAVGKVTAASANSLTVTFTTPPAAVGSLTAVVTTSGGSSGVPIQIASVVPVVIASAANLPADAKAILINGFGFDPAPGKNTLAFSDGAAGSVAAASKTSLLVKFSTKPVVAGNLTVIVTTDGVSSVAPVQVATVTPVVNPGAATLAADASSVVIDGFGFSPVSANDSVVFNDGAVGSVTAASAASLTVTFSVKPLSAGKLTAVVSSNGISSGAPVQVATVSPVVTANTAFLPPAAASVVIDGFGFAPAPAGNSVVFNAGAVGRVTAASAKSLTVAFSVKPASGGILTAVVTSNSVPSGAPVEVAALTGRPMITKNPVAQTVVAGGTASFTAAASGSPAPSVQWQVKVKSGSSFVNVAGATSPTLSFTASASEDGNQYRAVFTNSAGTATTSAAALKVEVGAVAVNDFAYTANKTPVDVPVLANDFNPDGFPITIRTVTTGRHGTVTILPGATQVRYTPNGNVQSDSFTYTINNGVGGTSTATVTVQNLFLAAAGTYNGLVRAAPGVTQANGNSGRLRVTIDPATGKFTGTFRLAVDYLILSGSFDAAGAARFGSSNTPYLVVHRPNLPDLHLALQLTLASEIDGLTGTLTLAGAAVKPAAATAAASGAEFGEISADRALYTAAKNPVAPYRNVPTNLLGKYTVVFAARPAPNQGFSASQYPQGDGVGVMTVTADGNAKVRGAFADGTPFLYVNALSKTNQWPFYAGLIGGKGSISGVGNFRDNTVTVSDVDGVGMNWFQPPNTQAQVYPAGWLRGIKTDLVGSKFVIPPASAGRSILPGLSGENSAGNAIVNLVDGNVPMPGITQAFNVSPQNTTTVVPPNPHGVSLHVRFLLENPCYPSNSPSVLLTGLYAGDFTDPETRATTQFTGVILQKQKAGYGFFLSGGQSGAGTLSPRPSAAK